MPFGPWPDFEACVSDAAMLAAFPGEEVRRRVCGTLEQRLKGDAGVDGDLGVVLDAGPYWILRGNTVDVEGANNNGRLKLWEELQAATPSLEGVPFVWGHPEGGDRMVEDPSVAAGIVVNARAREDRSVGYDLVLFKQRPPGYKTSDEDLQRNAAAVALARAGVPIHNSPGFRSLPLNQEGVWVGRDLVARRFHQVRRNIKYDHVAGLAPVAGMVPGACPVAQGCGVGVGAVDEACPFAGLCPHAGACRHGGAGALESEVRRLMAGGASRAVALRAILDAASPQ